MSSVCGNPADEDKGNTASVPGKTGRRGVGCSWINHRVFRRGAAPSGRHRPTGSRRGAAGRCPGQAAAGRGGGRGGRGPTNQRGGEGTQVVGSCWGLSVLVATSRLSPPHPTLSAVPPVSRKGHPDRGQGADWRGGGGGRGSRCYLLKKSLGPPLSPPLQESANFLTLMNILSCREVGGGVSRVPLEKPLAPHGPRGRHNFF